MNPAPFTRETSPKPAKTLPPVAHLLRDTRQALGYTIEGWRKLLHVGWRTVEGWELEGHIPHAATLIRLRTVLSTPEHQLILAGRPGLLADLRRAALC